MNKSELIEQLALKKDLPVKRAEELVNMIFSSMSEAMVQGERIEIRGLGSFVIKEYGTYTGRNPKTGEEIPITARRVVTFHASQKLKAAVESAPRDNVERI